jgi:uncharacterized cupredoxin-like copper-binding protein
MAPKTEVRSQQRDTESTAVAQDDQWREAVRTVRETIPVSTPTRHAEGTDLVRETVPARRRRRFGGLKGFVILALVAAGAAVGAIVYINGTSGTGPLTVRVTLMDYMVMPARRHLPVGKPITFVITNRGHHTHELVLERASAIDKALRYHGRAYEASQIKPGTTRRVTWTIPRKGTYKLACHLDHHYQMGMKTLITAANT